MVRKSWVIRRADSVDLRVTRIALSASGERLFQDIWPMIAELNAAATAALPEPMIELVRWAL
ncbi:MAG: hypothetical protein FJX52_15920 [Alphaproteobacteria bacterium]|nr:hypothetical protein [Alphaproteobacteria bacterium]